MNLFFVDSQNLQLSYADADIAKSLIRSGTTTTISPPTTKKSTFFGGIRDYFRKKPEDASSTTTVSTPVTPSAKLPTNDLRASASSPATTTSTAKPPNGLPNLAQQNPPPITTNHQSTAKPQTVSPTTKSSVGIQSIQNPTILISTSTAATPKVKEEFPSLPKSAGTPTTPTTKSTNVREDFPALPTRKNSAAAPVTPPPVNSAWAIPPSIAPPPMVSFVSTSTKQPAVGAGEVSTSTSSTPVTDNIPNSEFETFFENLFNKDSSNLLQVVTADYQRKTQSSSLSDDAPEP